MENARLTAAGRIILIDRHREYGSATRFAFRFLRLMQYGEKEKEKNNHEETILFSSLLFSEQRESFLDAKHGPTYHIEFFDIENAERRRGTFRISFPKAELKEEKGERTKSTAREITMEKRGSRRKIRNEDNGNERR